MELYYFLKIFALPLPRHRIGMGLRLPGTRITGPRGVSDVNRPAGREAGHRELMVPIRHAPKVDPVRR